MTGGWAGFADFCKALALQQRKGRASLRRDWRHLRVLADEVFPQIPDEVAHALLGKAKEAADPEENDVKALIAWAVGRGFLDPSALRDALDADNVSSPLYWLATLSGKSFGENVAPQLCAYWLLHDGDEWRKQTGRAYFDIQWTPGEHPQRSVRMELKASSENPGFRFQQIRDPRHTGADELDYDLLLCVGVTAATMEFWSIPAREVAEYIDDGTFGNQHGGSKMTSNTFWFVTDVRTRAKLRGYYTEAVSVRQFAIQQMARR